ncbi:Fbox domain containing protein [Acanthamoeba castellanii str. Neff]|uniref:Fbox domain containing protein n=1 Tax=Acanthamoeba castellanii (strain ATCC 30010 / Neff) TaxID=1257118 RepID=L8GYJ0_ACACF|nr:Fbox domain containing protein [Acanthamoeba castellanii str. Neff]ELR18354.1 Fbox domain containing protein [Acanthamoeba castellanii str. Neff]
MDDRPIGGDRRGQVFYQEMKSGGEKRFGLRLPPMDELPGEMVVAVLGWVEVLDLVASHQVCRRWRHLLSASGGGGLWRRSYLRTWPPPLSSAAHHAVIATAAQPIDWRALASASNATRTSKRGWRKWRHSCALPRLWRCRPRSAPSPRRPRRSPIMAPQAAEKKKKRKVMESESDDDKSAQAALQSAHQRHIADVQGPVEKAQQVLAYLNRVAGLRQRAHQLLHSFGPQGKANASEKVSKEHLLTMLFHGNMLYGKIHHKKIALGDVMHSLKYEASIVVYSLVTGLPLLMTYSFSYNLAESIDKLSWKSDQLEGVVEEMQCRAEAKADYAALQVFLFGWENADTVDPPALEKFIEGVFVPTNNFYVNCWVPRPK